MNNCIFTAHCTEAFCDKSCPTLVETSYLLERNNIQMNSFVFHTDPVILERTKAILARCSGSVGLVTVSSGSKIVPSCISKFSTVEYADILTYCAICQNYQGSRLHCSVYNLKYSKYLDAIKKSWSMKSEPEDLEYMRIWSESAKVLIISNFDYVNFGDFECQTILNLLQTRTSSEFTTILVSPPIRNLISSKSSLFFNRLKEVMTSAEKVVSAV